MTGSFALVSITHSITIFPASFLTAIEILSLCTSMPIYLVLVIKGVPPLERLSSTLKTYSTRGALLYCVVPAQPVDATPSSALIRQCFPERTICPAVLGQDRARQCAGWSGPC